MARVVQPTRAASHAKTAAGIPIAGIRNRANSNKIGAGPGKPARIAVTTPMHRAAIPNSVFDKIARDALTPATKAHRQFDFFHHSTEAAVVVRTNRLAS